LVDPKIQVIPFSERLNTLQRIGVDLGLSSTAGLNDARNAVGQALYAVFFHEAQINERDRFVPEAIKRVRQHIEDSIGEEIAVSDLASIAELTPQHLIASFRKHMGLTPMRYLWQIRADRGRMLLLQSGLSVSEIAFVPAKAIGSRAARSKARWTWHTNNPRM